MIILTTETFCKMPLYLNTKVWNVYDKKSSSKLDISHSPCLQTGNLSTFLSGSSGNHITCCVPSVLWFNGDFQEQPRKPPYQYFIASYPINTRLYIYCAKNVYVEQHKVKVSEWRCHSVLSGYSMSTPWLFMVASSNGGFPSQKSVTRSFDILFDMSLNKRLSKQNDKHLICSNPMQIDAFIPKL